MTVVNMNQSFFGLAVRQAKAYREAVRPLPIIDTIDPEAETFERACNRVDVSVIDFINVANKATPAQAVIIHAELERLLISLGCAADVAKDRSLGPRNVQNGAA